MFIINFSIYKTKIHANNCLLKFVIQLELDKVSEAFREAHKARQELLEQWESTIVQMQKRDAEMDEASLQLMELRMEANKRQEGLKEQQVWPDLNVRTIISLREFKFSYHDFPLIVDIVVVAAQILILQKKLK